MPLQGSTPRVGVGRVAHEDLVAAHDAIFHLVEPDQAPKLRWLVRLPLSNGLGVRLEEAEHLTRHVSVSPEDALPSLRDHPLDQRDEVPQLRLPRQHRYRRAHDLEPPRLQVLHDSSRLAKHSLGQLQNLPIAVLETLPARLREDLG